MLYEIVNPSDACVLEADDRRVAACAVLLLGRGAYALTPETGEEGVPLFLFDDPLQWFQQTFGEDLQQFVEQNRLPIVTCLRTVTYGNFGDYRTFRFAVDAIDDVEKRTAFIEKWQDERRSSMNNIGRSAQRLADALEAKEQEEREKRLADGFGEVGHDSDASNVEYVVSAQGECACEE